MENKPDAKELEAMKKRLLEELDKVLAAAG